MSRWIWHGWQSPEVKKVQNWWLDLLPPDWASRVSSNIFPFELLIAKKWNWLQLSSNLPYPSQPAQVANQGSAGQCWAWPLWSERISTYDLANFSFFLFLFSSIFLFSLPFLPPSFFIPSFSFLSHLSLPVLRDCYSTSVLLRTKEPAAFLLK